MSYLNVDLLSELLHLPAPWRIEGWEIDQQRRVLRVQVGWPSDVAVFCPQCQASCVVHDHREPRRWRHLDCMEYQTWIVCRQPRSRCREHGVRTVSVPWAEPLSRMTPMFEQHCIAVLLSCQTVTAAQRLLGIGESEVASVRRRAVQRGLQRRDLSRLQRGGLDEKSFLRGQSYVTVLSDVEQSCVVEVTQGRTQEAAEQALQVIPISSRNNVSAMAMDMHNPFQRAVENVLPQAAIVHDRYHIKRHLLQAVEQVRRAEHKQLSKQGDTRLCGTRFLFLRKSQNWSEKDARSFEELASSELKITRAYWLKELFDKLYSYRSESWARRFFQRWFFRATHSQLPPLAKAAWRVKRHFENVVTYIKHQLTNAVAEGLNSKIQALKSAARGFRNFQNYRTAILFHCGRLDLLPYA
jgi:transposase